MCSAKIILGIDQPSEGDRGGKPFPYHPPPPRKMRTHGWDPSLGTPWENPRYGCRRFGRAALAGSGHTGRTPYRVPLDHDQ